MKPTGKTVAQHTYLHVSALDELDSAWRESVSLATELAKLRAGDFNVVKLSHGRSSISLPDYPDFFEEGFPLLRRYWTIDPGTSNDILDIKDGLTALIASKCSRKVLPPTVMPSSTTFVSISVRVLGDIKEKILFEAPSP